jgi:hypothetical protein
MEPFVALVPMAIAKTAVNFSFCIEGNSGEIC